MFALPGFDPSLPQGTRRRVMAVLVVATAAISFAPVLVKGIGALDPVVIALWRTTLVGLVLLPALRPMSRADMMRTALAGVCLAAHFSTWFASLQRTSVMRSTVLVCLTPLWVGLIEWLVLGRAPRARFWPGVALAVLGVSLMGLGAPGDADLIGDLLALGGGVLGAAYILLGSVVRARVPISSYACAVCLAAAASLWPVALLTSDSLLPADATTWLLLGLLALGPQLLGHNGFNYALRYLPAAVTSAAMLLEPVGATALAWVILGEVPTPTAAAGVAVVVGGVVLATVDLSKR